MILCMAWLREVEKIYQGQKYRAGLKYLNFSLLTVNGCKYAWVNEDKAIQHKNSASLEVVTVNSPSFRYLLGRAHLILDKVA